MNWVDRRSHGILRRLRASLTNEREAARLRCIRSVAASSQEVRERAAWNLQDCTEILQLFDDSPQGRQLMEWDADIREDGQHGQNS